MRTSSTFFRCFQIFKRIKKILIFCHGHHDGSINYLYAALMSAVFSLKNYLLYFLSYDMLYLKYKICFNTLPSSINCFVLLLPSVGFVDDDVPTYCSTKFDEKTPTLPCNFPRHNPALSSPKYSIRSPTLKLNSSS